MHPKFEHDICVLTYTKILCGVYASIWPS